MILAFITVVLVAFIIVALLVASPGGDDNSVDGFPADWNNRR